MGQNQTYKHWLASWQWQQRCDYLTGIRFVRATLEPDLAKKGLQAQDRMAAS